MTDIAISVKKLSKKYRLYASPQHRLKEALHPFRKKFHREFWALKDVSFDIKRGETIGIIGRNGSGKSTLLQIICSVLMPTTGEITVDGRISALLELGAGFNQEFTGRENVLLQGITKGFSKDEMEARMPLIEEFAEIGEFIDQPVRIYSSGMFVRLAFSAAINVDPDILVVDEALAVGDAKFQHKCYNKFLEFQKAGKTVVLVTHDITAIVKHCDHAILLENGMVLENGKPNDVVERYEKLILTGSLDESERTPSEDKSLSYEKATSHMDMGNSELERFLQDTTVSDKCIYRKSYNKNEYRFGNKRAEIIDYLIVCANCHDAVVINSGEKVDLYIKALFNDNVESPFFGYGIKTVDGIYIYAINTNHMDVSLTSAKRSDIVIIKLSTTLNLQAGDYFISIGIAENQRAVEGLKYDMADSRHDMIHLSVKSKNCFDGLVDFNMSYDEIIRTKGESFAFSEKSTE